MKKYLRKKGFIQASLIVRTISILTFLPTIVSASSYHEAVAEQLRINQQIQANSQMPQTGLYSQSKVFENFVRGWYEKELGHILSDEEVAKYLIDSRAQSIYQMYMNYQRSYDIKIPSTEYYCKVNANSCVIKETIATPTETIKPVIQVIKPVVNLPEKASIKKENVSEIKETKSEAKEMNKLMGYLSTSTEINIPKVSFFKKITSWFKNWFK